MPLKEYGEFKGRDVRAVENPYEAAFELAGTAGAFSRRTLMWLSVLAFFFFFYMALTVFVIYLNLYVFNRSDLRYLGLAMALVNIGMGVLSLWRIASSISSFRLIGRNHALLQKLDSATPGKPAGTFEARPSAGARPQSAVNGLIETVIADSRELLVKFRFVYLFIALWMVNAVIYFTIQSVRFGPNLLGWTLDWIMPGGFGADAFFFLAISIIAYLKARDRFDFLRARYQAIEYEMGRPRAKVPAGGSPLERYQAFLATGTAYGSPSGWKKAAYFDGVLEGQSGKVLVKALAGTPDAEALAGFVSHARAQGENVRHAVILYPEDPDKPLADTVYNEVVNNPIRVGSALFAVELVMEGRDGFYDFIPVVSP
jgi:hypothetical protein